MDGGGTFCFYDVQGSRSCRRTSETQQQQRAADLHSGGPATENEKKEGFFAALPAGSYQQSCSPCALRGSILSCRCRNVRNRQLDASLVVKNCSDNSIYNDNGELKCTQRPKVSSSVRVPDGSYQKTCMGCMMGRDGNMDVLSCDKCRRANGTWSGVTNAVFVPYCRPASIYNDNGQLKC